MKSKLTFRFDDIKTQLSEQEAKSLQDIITTARVTRQPQKAVFSICGMTTCELAVFSTGLIMRIPCGNGEE